MTKGLVQQQGDNATHQSDVTYPVNFQELRSVSLSMPVFAHIGMPLTALSDRMKMRAKASSLKRHEQPLATTNDRVSGDSPVAIGNAEV